VIRGGRGTNVDRSVRSATVSGVIKTALLLTGALLLAAGDATANDAPANDPFVLQDLLPRSLQSNPRIQLAVITEYTAEGIKIPPATPQHPVYYVGSDSDVIAMGDTVAGEKLPAVAKLNAAMEKALATNGYLPADKAHPPSLFIFYRWGSFNHLETSLNMPTDGGGAGGIAEVDQDDISPMDEQQQLNLVERAAIVGGTHFAFEVKRALQDGHLQEFRQRDVETSELMTQAEQDLYFVIASAYDFDAAKNGQKKLIWRTKMSTSSQGIQMDRTLPQLVTNAAPYFGCYMAKAVPLHVRIYAGKVEMEAPKVEGYVQPPVAK